MAEWPNGERQTACIPVPMDVSEPQEDVGSDQEVTLVLDPMVHHNIYMVGAGHLTCFEEDLKQDFFKQQIYLIRGVQMSGLPVPSENGAEALAFGLICCGQARWTQIERLLGLLPCDRSLRWKQENSSTLESQPKRFTTGAYVRGPMLGTTINSRQYPWTTRALAGIIRTWDSELSFTSATISCNVCAGPHRDSYNESRSHNLVLPVSVFQGGEIFLEHAEGKHRLQQKGPPGHIISTQEAVSFSPRRLHATLPWHGTRIILIAYHVGMSANMDPVIRRDLQAMGFKVGEWTRP